MIELAQLRNELDRMENAIREMETKLFTLRLDRERMLIQLEKIAIGKRKQDRTQQAERVRRGP